MSEEMNTAVLSDFSALTEKLLTVMMEKEWEPLSVFMAGLVINRTIDTVLQKSPDIISPAKLKEFRKLAEPLVDAVMNIAMAGMKKEKKSA